jgi:hypothetical protein
MATGQKVNGSNQKQNVDNVEILYRKTYRLVGLVNGLLIGLALALAIWGPQVLTLSKIPTEGGYASMIMATTLLVFATGFVGWVTATIGKTWASILIWFLASLVIALIIAYQSNWIRSFTVWISDLRFWGLPVFPIVAGTIGGLILTGFFVIGLLSFLGLLQDMRLDGVLQAMGEKHRFSLGALGRLLLPLPLVAIAGLLTANMQQGVGSPKAMQIVHEAISTGRTYEGDLYELAQQEGLNYHAIQGVRDQMSANYTLTMGEVDPDAASTIVFVDFDNGSWIACQIIAGTLNFCYDAAPPFTIGLASLITGEPVPEDCRFCTPAADEALLEWLRDRGDSFEGQPQITRQAQQGAMVLVRAESTSGDYAIECLLGGSRQVEVISCKEVEA